MRVVGEKPSWRGVWLGLVVVVFGSIAALGVGVNRSPTLQFELGYAFENGQFHGWTPGFAKNHQKAAYWLERAAQANHPRAQYMLGILLGHGWGVAKDDARAVAWFTRSARNNYPAACHHLGWMYLKGDGVQQDAELGRRLLEQASVLGR
jgi:hypothetical protein